MAINKNFVIKNGVEVNTNLLVGDSTLNKVGIATTVPGYTLHIGVGDGARGGIGATDITVTGIATIGVANSTSGALSVTGISTFEGLVDANGGISARTAAVQDLTDNRVVIAGSGGELEDSANLTFDGSTLTVSGDLDPTNVSIASTLQVAGVATFLSGTLVSGIGTFESDIKVGTAATIQSNGAAAFAGIVTANGGLAVGSAASIHSNGNASFSGIVTVGGNLNVTGDYSVDEISARNLILTGIATIPTLGVTGIGTFEKLTVGTGVTLQEHGGVSIAGITTIGGNLGVTGNITASGDATLNGGDLTLSSTAPSIIFTETNDNPDYEIQANGGVLAFTDTTASANRMTIASNGVTVPTGSAFVGSGVTIQSHGGVSIAGITTIGGALDVDGATTLDGLTVAEPAAFSDNVTISGVTTTGENLGGFKRLVGAASSTVVSIAVTVAAKTADHRYFGQGSGNGYWLDGVQSPFLTLVPGKLYYFDQSHSTNANHPLRFYLEQDKANAYTTEITTGGTPGSSGAYTQIGIGTASNENNHPAVLHYQCSAHGLMGNAVATQSNSVNLPDSSAATIRANLTVNGDIDLSGSIDVDGTANIDVLDVDEGANIAGGLVANSAQISDLTDNRVVIAGSSGELEDSGNLTFDGSTLGITGSIDLSADIDVDGTANLDVLDVDGASNFGADVVFAGAAANITFDQDVDDLIFGDNAKAVFGGAPGAQDGLEISHNGTNSILKNNTGDLEIRGSVVKILGATGAEGSVFNRSGSVELTHNGTQTLFTTGIGITVGLTTLQRNGNASFAGITTVGGILDANGRIDGASGANFSGIVTSAAAYITKLATNSGSSGNANEVPVATGSGGWNWQPVNTTGAGDITGITVREEGSNVGTANSITILNFVGNDVTADATQNQGICTITVDSNIAGINTLHQSYFHDQHITGVVSFISSDQEAVFNVGTAATIYKNGNVRTTGVITAFGGFDVGAGTTAKIFSNGNANFSGIVTAGSGFNIGIQSAGIVIAKNVGINTLNFVGSGNSITYFAATNTLDVSIAGSSGGGGGGVSETETAVSSTSATSTGSFAKASFRSASILAQITQGSAYQVGRYLLIHDGTTVTTIEESAVATGSMLGTFEGVINGSNVEFRVTMSSSSSATVTTKIDTISIP